MYSHAHEYLQMGNLDGAITTYKQLLTFVPGNATVSTELADAYYRKGDFQHTTDVLATVTGTAAASEQAYQLMAAGQAGLNHYKEAKETTKAGLQRFPNSGLIYFEQGKVYFEDNEEPDALRSWMDGTEKAPAYAPNYHEIAMSFFNCDEVLWGLVYGEQYLAMPHDTAGDDGFKKSLFDAWKKFFNHIAEPAAKVTFSGTERDILNSYKQLTPVVSDGTGTENLTMVRTRFLMEWGKRGDMQDIFRYEETLVREGWFDIYNEWLFGKAESDVQYQAWNTFHEGAMNKYLAWRAEHPYLPAWHLRPADRNLDILLARKRKR